MGHVFGSMVERTSGRVWFGHTMYVRLNDTTIVIDGTTIKYDNNITETVVYGTVEYGTVDDNNMWLYGTKFMHVYGQ